MMRKKELLTALGTLGCAVGIGFIMQSGEVADLRYGALLGTDPEESDAFPLDVQAVTLTSVAVTPPVPVVFDEGVEVTVPPADPTSPEIKKQTASSKPRCDVSFVAFAKSAAMVDLSLSAPCSANQTVQVEHEGLHFSTTTGPDGTFNMTVPALAADASFLASFETGDEYETSARVENVMLYDRVVVQWEGPQGLQIHAREYGAAYGESGHVWYQNPRDMTAITVSEGGFLNRYGNAETPAVHMAEVYTFPSALTDRNSAVELSVEAEVTAANCGTQISGSAMEVVGGNLKQSKKITLMAPGCDAVGEYLVLNNLLQSLTVASR